MIVLRLIAFAFGAFVAMAAFSSGIRAVVIPRGDQVLVTDAVFRVVQRFYRARARRIRDPERRESLYAGYAGVSMMVLPFVWITMVIVGFAFMFWSFGVPGPRDALELSGSSVTTLGFFRAPDAPTTCLAVLEATIGLGIVALLISFLPTMYSLFSQRELMVSLMRTRAGIPPRAAEWLGRAHRIGWMEDELDAQWLEWERWFLQLEESHTSYPALTFFRSPTPQSSWITTAGVILDTAALRASVLEMPRSIEAQLCLRSGYLALRRIADNFGFDYDSHPEPDDPISITRADFDEAVESLRSAGVPLKADLDEAWASFAGWRVNYDAVLLTLCGLLRPPPAPWSSDRAPVVHLEPWSFRRRKPHA